MPRTRGRGAGFVYRYTRGNVSFLRRATGRPVHVIAGLSDGLSSGEARAAMRGARAGGAIGAGFYDFSLSLDPTWNALEVLSRPRVRGSLEMTSSTLVR